MKGFFLVLVYVFNFDFFEFSATILEKGLFLALSRELHSRVIALVDSMWVFSVVAVLYSYIVVYTFAKTS